MSKQGKQLILNFGVLGGVLYMLYYIGGYVFNPDIFIGYIKSILFVVTVIFMVLVARSYKMKDIPEEGPGFAKFRSLFSVMVLTILVISVISNLSSLLVFQVLDPGLADDLSEKALNKGIEMAESFGATEEQIDQIAENSEGQNLFTLKSHLTNFIVWFLGYSVIALIIAAIFKKNPPAPLEQNEIQ